MRCAPVRCTQITCAHLLYPLRTIETLLIFSDLLTWCSIFRFFFSWFFTEYFKSCLIWRNSLRLQFRMLCCQLLAMSFYELQVIVGLVTERSWVWTPSGIWYYKQVWNKCLEVSTHIIFYRSFQSTTSYIAKNIQVEWFIVAHSIAASVVTHRSRTFNRPSVCSPHTPSTTNHAAHNGSFKRSWQTLGMWSCDCLLLTHTVPKHFILSLQTCATSIKQSSCQKM